MPMRILLCVLAGLLSFGAHARSAAAPESVQVKREGVEPTQDEQLFIYLLNKARHDPPAYGKSIGLNLDQVIPRPPLALNKELTASARFRAGDQAKRRYFGHTDPDGVGPNRHARESGYKLAASFGSKLADNNIESCSGGDVLPADALKRLIVDEGVPSLGHRKHLLGMVPNHDSALEVGVGAVIPAPADGAVYAAYYTIHTARTDKPEAFVTGVVYDDKNANGAYDPGEGLGGVTVAGGGQNVKTFVCGGFAFPLKPGPVLVGCHQGEFKGQATAQVLMDNRNVHLEFVSGKKEAVLNFGKPIPAPQAAKRR
ncbi:MAG: hypothetical protein AMXMBFR7_06790 [Planctomycetota bacterium]